MSRIQAPAAVETHSIPPFSAAILKYSYSAVSPRSNPAKAAFITGIRKPLLARALLRVRRAAAANDRAKAGVLRTRHIALWDVAAECSIRGSADSSISAVTANDIAPLLRSTQIKAVF